MLDLLLVRPNDNDVIYGKTKGQAEGLKSQTACEPPYWAAMIAAFVRGRGYHVAVLDAEAENMSAEQAAQAAYAYQPALIGIIVTGNNLSASTQKMRGAGILAKALKGRQISPVFMWGLHPSALPERSLQEEAIDFVIKGENLPQIAQLLQAVKDRQEEAYSTVKGLYYWKDNAVCGNPEIELLPLDAPPSPAWDLLPMERYHAHNWQLFGQEDGGDCGYGIVATSLGCPFHCEFCAIASQFGSRKVRYFTPEQVIEQFDVLVKQYHVKYFKILDENFILNIEHVEKICDLLISRNYDINCWAYARVDTVNREVLEKCSRAGIKWLAYGIESANELALADVSKGQYTCEKIRQVMEMTHEAGCNIMANFMFGLPDDTIESMQETLEFARQINPDYINFYSVMAYPGSRLYTETFMEHPEYLPETWMGYAQYSYECQPLPTKYISAAEVLRFRDDAYHAFFENNDRYFEMVFKKFGQQTVDAIKKGNQKRLKRKLLEEITPETNGDKSLGGTDTLPYLSSKRNVYFCEFNLVMGNAVYLPIATASLAAYAKTIRLINDNYQFMPYLFIKQPMDDIIEKIDNPAVLALSISMWNYEYSLALAKRVKEKYPNCMILCGGPSVPFDAESFFSAYPFIDIACRGEGELIFSEILLELLKPVQDFTKIDGISFRQDGKTVCCTQNHKLMALENYISPYLSGEFDYLFTKEPRQYEYQLILETNRGCPFQYGYCFWGMNGLVSKMRYFPLEKVYKTIDWIAEHKIKYVFCADSNFGIIERDIAIAKYLEKSKTVSGYPEKFRVCFAKNSLDRNRQIGEILSRSGLSKSTTISFQSRNQEALKNIRRQNVSVEEFDEFVSICNKKHIATYTEFILGFPGETYESFLTGIREILDVNLHNEIFVYLCSILPNTYIADKGFLEKFKIQKQRIPLNEIHCSIHPADGKDGYVQEYEEIISGCNTLSQTEMVRIMAEMSMLQMLYSLQLGYTVIRFLYNEYQLDLIDFVEYLINNCDSLPAENFLCKNAKECIDVYRNILIYGAGRGVVEPRYGAIYWEVEEKCFLDDVLLDKNQITQDLNCAFSSYFKYKAKEIDLEMLNDCICYQVSMLPDYQLDKEGKASDTAVFLFDWPEYYSAGEKGLTKGEFKYQIIAPDIAADSLEEFAKMVVLWGRKGGILFNRFQAI